MEARPPANGGPKKPGKDKAKRWATYTPDQQAAWEAAGIVDAVDAHSFDRFGIDVATVAQIVQVGEVRGSIGKLFTDRVLTMGQVRERLRQVPIPGTEPADPREVVCPVCGVDEGQDCDDGGTPAHHPRRSGGEGPSAAARCARRSKGGGVMNRPAKLRSCVGRTGREGGLMSDRTEFNWPRGYKPYERGGALRGSPQAPLDS
jgi:hypothetical protein